MQGLKRIKQGVGLQFWYPKVSEVSQRIICTGTEICKLCAFWYDQVIRTVRGITQNAAHAVTDNSLSAIWFVLMCFIPLEDMGQEGVVTMTVIFPNRFMKIRHLEAIAVIWEWNIPMPSLRDMWTNFTVKALGVFLTQILSPCCCSSGFLSVKDKNRLEQGNEKLRYLHRWQCTPSLRCTGAEKLYTRSERMLGFKLLCLQAH